MKKVKFNTKLEHEFINNYKILQEAFKHINIEKVCISAIHILPVVVVDVVFCFFS